MILIFIFIERFQLIDTDWIELFAFTSLHLVRVTASTYHSCLVHLGGEKVDVDVGEDTTGCDGSLGHESVELFIVADGELDVTGHNSGLLVVLGGVTGELEDLSCEVLKDGGEVHWGTGTDTLSVSALLQETGESSDWELKSSLGCSANGASGSLALASSSFTCSGHCVKCVCFCLKLIIDSDPSSYKDFNVAQ